MILDDVAVAVAVAVERGYHRSLDFSGEAVDDFGGLLQHLGDALADQLTW